jgi:indole-3-glycerol phosphate synthase
MNILDQIIEWKYMEVEQRKSIIPVSALEQSIYFRREPLSLKKAILREGSCGIIAEFKRRSPSAGIINGNPNAHEVCLKYESSGSSAVSVLTDNKFFGGSAEDLTEVRNHVDCPVIRKDFIIDEYQIIEAKAIGADAVLLIAELHHAERLARLYDLAKSIGLEVLLEVHEEKNIFRIPGNAEIIGINSRNLKSMNVDFDHLNALNKMLPGNVVKIAESGIRSPEDYFTLKNSGFNGFLIGEHFMRTDDPGKACSIFIESIRNNTLNHLHHQY